MKIRILLIIVFVALSIQLSAQDSTHTYVPVKALAVLWQQHAAEYNALCHQAFNIARTRLDDMKLRKRHKYAIITDVDETVLDNSHYEARQILAGKGFDPATWKKWTDESAAEPVPGAIEFLKYAHSKGVEIFYVSNRDTTEVQSTMSNLSRLGFPDADSKHLLFKSNTSAKEPRRTFIEENYKVVMLLGDNLNDFLTTFEQKTNEERQREADRLKDEWGRKFIVIPNVTYGEWENALYQYKRLPQDKQVEILKQTLKTTPSN